MLKEDKQFAQFLKSLTSLSGDQIISIIEFGSGKGRECPKSSDIDLLILAKNQKSVTDITNQARNIEKEIYSTRDPVVVSWVEKLLFIRPIQTGIHLVVIGADELTDKFEPSSLRLKILSATLIQKNFLIAHLKKQGRVLYGEDIIQSLPISHVGLIDLVRAALHCLLCLLIAPLISFSLKTLQIRICKAILFFNQVLEIYLDRSTSWSTRLQQFRYNLSSS